MYVTTKVFGKSVKTDLSILFNNIIPKHYEFRLETKTKESYKLVRRKGYLVWVGENSKKTIESLSCRDLKTFLRLSDANLIGCNIIYQS